MSAASLPIARTAPIHRQSQPVSPLLLVFFFKQKTAYEVQVWLEFRRVLFRSVQGREGPAMSLASKKSGQSAVVTGAGSGLGRDIALALAAKGYIVFGTAFAAAEVQDLKRSEERRVGNECTAREEPQPQTKQ